MRARRLFLGMAFVVALYQQAEALEKPPELMVGRWKVREQKNDLPEPKTTEMFEFNADGKGKVSKTTEQKTEAAVISWSMTATYGNACILRISYDDAPKEVQPLVLLWVFDGSDTAILQARSDRITFLDRQKDP
jgi:hypothetical protein